MGQVVTLIGFMGSGKSTVGHRAAELLGCRFVDLDDYIEQREGTTIGEIFGRRGEPGFRQSELGALESLLAAHSQPAGCLVIAVGGGAPTIAETRRVIRNAGAVIFLDVPVEDAWQRAKGTGRPLAQDARSFQTLYERRHSIYQELADAVVHTRGASLDKVAAEVAETSRALLAGAATTARATGAAASLRKKASK